MQFLFSPVSDAVKRKGVDKTAVAQFMGADSPEGAEAAWEKAHKDVLSKTFTVEEAEHLLLILLNIAKLWNTHRNAAMDKSIKAFFEDDNIPKAEAIKEKVKAAQPHFDNLQALIGHVQSFIDAAEAAFQSTRPSDETVEKMGYNLADFGADGWMEYGDDWFYKPGAESLYADAEFFNAICPECGCSGLSWMERCGCRSEDCGCGDA